MPQEPLKIFHSGTAVLLNSFKQFSNDQAQSSERRAVIVIESNYTPRTYMLCTEEHLIFSQLMQNSNQARCWRTGPCVSTPVPMTEVESASCQCSWGCTFPLSLEGQGWPLWLSWRHSHRVNMIHPGTLSWCVCPNHIRKQLWPSEDEWYRSQLGTHRQKGIFKKMLSVCACFY